MQGLKGGDIIHLFPLHKGDMKICSPEKSHISWGQRPSEIWLFRGWANFHISLMQGKWMFYSTRPTFWWILTNEIFWPSLFTKLLFRNISGVIFTNMEYRYMTHSQKSWVILLMNIHQSNRVMSDVSKQTLNHIWKTLVKTRIYFFQIIFHHSFDHIKKLHDFLWSYQN